MQLNIVCGKRGPTGSRARLSFTHPPDLSQRFVDHGFEDVEPMYGMARSLASLPDLSVLPPNIQIRKAEDWHVTAYHLAVLHTTPMAQKLYESMGFASIAEFRLFASDDVYI